MNITSVFSKLRDTGIKLIWVVGTTQQRIIGRIHRASNTGGDHLSKQDDRLGCEQKSLLDDSRQKPNTKGLSRNINEYNFACLSQTVASED